MSTERNKARTREFYEQVLSSEDLDRLDDYVTEDFVDHNPTPGAGSGREGVRHTFEMFREAFPDMKLTVDEMYADGDTVITRVTMSGTHEGEFMGIAPTGESIAVQGIDIIRLDGDRAAERWGQFDDLGTMQQLGVFPDIGTS